MECDKVNNFGKCSIYVHLVFF